MNGSPSVGGGSNVFGDSQGNPRGMPGAFAVCHSPSQSRPRSHSVPAWVNFSRRVEHIELDSFSQQLKETFKLDDEMAHTIREVLPDNESFRNALFNCSEIKTLKDILLFGLIGYTRKLGYDDNYSGSIAGRWEVEGFKLDDVVEYLRILKNLCDGTGDMVCMPSMGSK